MLPSFSSVCLAVSIPGARGNPGPAGADGADGLSASTFLTADFVMPAQGSSGTAEVADSLVFSFGEVVYLAVAGYLQIVGIPDPTHLILLNLRDDATGGGGGGSGVHEVFFGTGDPNGVVTATQPAVFYTAAGEVWVKTAPGTTNTDWTQLII